MPYVNGTYIEHINRELIPQLRKRTNTTANLPPDKCPCDTIAPPPRQSALDAAADARLDYGPGYRPGVLPQRRSQRRAPRLSRYTPYGQDKTSSRDPGYPA